MANWNYTKLTCNDLQRFTEIMKSNPFEWPHTGQSYEDKPVELDKDGAAFIHSRNALPEGEIKLLSAKNPDLIFTAEYSFEGEWHDTLYVCKYKNGEQIEEVLNANYTLSWNAETVEQHLHNQLVLGEHYDKLLDRAKEIFRRIDIVKTNEGGHKYLDFVSGISLTVEDDNFQMTVVKHHSWIEVTKCFEKRKETTIKLVPVEKDSLPF